MKQQTKRHSTHLALSPRTRVPTSAYKKALPPFPNPPSPFPSLPPQSLVSSSRAPNLSATHTIHFSTTAPSQTRHPIHHAPHPPPPHPPLQIQPRTPLPSAPPRPGPAPPPPPAPGVDRAKRADEPRQLVATAVSSSSTWTGEGAVSPGSEPGSGGGCEGG